MDIDESIAKYFERYIFVIKHNLKEVEKQDQIKCELVGLVAEDLFPDRTTAALGFCALLLKTRNDNRGKLILSSEEFRSYNEKTIEFCYHQLSLHINKHHDKDTLPQIRTGMNTRSKAELLLNLKDFEKKYRNDANGFRKWFEKTIEIRKRYGDLLDKHEEEEEYLKRILDEFRSGEVQYPVIIERIILNSQNEIEIKKMYLEQRHVNENRIIREIELHKTDIKACEYQYNYYTKIINDSMLENRTKERLSYLASFAVDYLERGGESIDFNNNRNFGYHSYLEIPSEGVLGDKKFAREEVKFSEKDIQRFLEEYYDYTIDQSNLNKIQLSHKPQKQSLTIPKNGKQKNLIIKEAFDKISGMQKNKNDTKEEIFNLIADKLKMNFDAVKYGYYYKSKKLAK